MSALDLRSFLASLQSDLPEYILNIHEEVPLDYTSTSLALALEKNDRHPVLLFEQLKDHPGRLVANLFASRRVMAYSVGVDETSFSTYLGDCLDALVPVRHVSSGPVHEVVLERQSADVTRLLIPRHFASDAGPYITAGMVAARDPDTGVNNLAYARLQVKEARKLGISLHSRQHLWDYQRRAEQAGKDLPVAVVIGAHPAVMLAAAAKMGIDQDEYELAGALLGESLPVCRAKTVDVEVPADAEIVIEGHIQNGVREKEGPFGEYTGYMTGRSTNNVMIVSAVTMRQDPIFVDIVPGNSAEHLTLGRASKEAWVFKRMKEALPFFVDFHFPSSGTHFHCYLRIDKTAEGQANQAAALLMGLDHYVKLVVVVDKDINIFNEAEVWWAVATRLQADRDVNVINNVMGNRLDPSSKDGLGAKMILDATAPMDAEAKRVDLPPEAVAYARQLLARYT